jgi:hypothetical protein
MTDQFELDPQHPIKTPVRTADGHEAGIYDIDGDRIIGWRRLVGVEIKLVDVWDLQGRHSRPGLNLVNVLKPIQRPLIRCLAVTLDSSRQVKFIGSAHSALSAQRQAKEYRQANPEAEVATGWFVFTAGQFVTSESMPEVPYLPGKNPWGLGQTEEPKLEETMGRKGPIKLKVDIVHNRPVTLDHAKALEYTELPLAPSATEVREAHVQFLLDAMRRGTFNPMLVLLATAVCDGKVYMINGSHVCRAVLSMPAGFSLEVREVHFRCPDEEQLRRLYMTYDQLGRPSGPRVLD